MSTFPWDAVKAETLRSVARDIGISATLKRDDMIHLFRMVEEDGRMCRNHSFSSMFGLRSSQRTVEAAYEEEKELRIVASSKRKAGFDSPPRPKRTRRSDPGPAKMVTRYKGVRTKTYRTTIAKPKPRSSRRAPAAAKGASARVVAGKFDGVVLPRRRRGKPKRQEDPFPPPPAEADGEGGDDVDADGDGDADVDVDADGDVDVDHDVQQPDLDQVEVKEGSEPLVGEGSEPLVGEGSEKGESPSASAVHCSC